MMRAASRRVAAPPAGVVDVWCVALDAPSPPLDTLLVMLDDDERGQVHRMSTGAEAWAAAHVALRMILAGCLEVRPEAVRFERTASGKPRLAGVRGLEFSFSRTDGLALVAVASDREVGVDVERENERTDVEAVTREFLSAGDRAAIDSVDPASRRGAFFAAWAKREARLKLRGQGLEVQSQEPGLAPGTLVVTRALTPRPGYAGAVAAEGSGWTVRMRAFAFPTTGGAR